MAKDWLNAGGAHNRKLIESSVARIKAAHGRREWMYDSTDAIGLTASGAVVNGQHRLRAIAEGAAGAWMLVARSVRPEVITIADQPMQRNLTQTLQIDGTYQDPSTTATAVEWVYRMIGHYERRQPSGARATEPQLLELLKAHPHIVDSVQLGSRAQSGAGVLSRGVYTAYHYAMSCADAPAADEFFLQLATGLDVDEGDPAYTLRERLNSERRKPVEKKIKTWEAATLLVRAWNANQAGDRLGPRQLIITKSGPKAQPSVPHVPGVDWLSGDDADDVDGAGA
jgi:hypothetical protein